MAMQLESSAAVAVSIDYLSLQIDMMFDNINLAHLLSSSKPLDIARTLNDEQIRSILPALLWLGLQQCPKNHRLVISAELLQIASRFHDMDSMIELLEVDFHGLSLEIKRLQRIKQKLAGEGQRNSQALINQEIIGFEQLSARDRCRVVAQVLFDDSEKESNPIVSSSRTEMIALIRSELSSLL